MILVFDTETTGKLNFRLPPDDESQPRMVQLGAILFSDRGRILAQLDLIIRPDGFTIPAEAAAIHGIDQATAEMGGVQLTDALGMFTYLAGIAHVLVAYNADFDRAILTGEFYREFQDAPWADDHRWVDPMKESTDLCKLPGPRGFKWPKLAEAYKILLGKELEGAHNALVDVKATADLYFHLHPPTKDDLFTP